MAHASDLRLLAHFAAIADAGSVRGAARTLRLSPAVVSAALSELEARMGVTLIQRTTRSGRLTPAGERVRGHAAAAMAEADLALASGKDAARSPSGDVRLSAPTELCFAWLPGLLAEFDAVYPEVRVAIDASDAKIDLAGSDIDVALTASFAWEPSEGPEVVACLPLALVASPRDDASSPLEVIAPEPGSTEIEALTATGATAELRSVRRFTVNDRLIALEMARAGLGAALVIQLSAAPDIRAGRLQILRPDLNFGCVVIRIRRRDRRPTAAAAALAAFLLRKRDPTC